MYNKILFFILCLLIPFFGLAQNCSLTVNGYVKDAGTNLPLEYVNILLIETQSGVVTDSAGFFTLSNVCKGGIHLVLSHIGCESQKVFIELTKDTTLNLVLDHSDNVLDGVEVTGQYFSKTTQYIETLKEQEIVDRASENLSNILSSIAGVSSLKSGNGISKPVVHGLYGNRLTILNNGIAQSGQQWGNDHSPEIDPLVANRISVIKGTAALEYLGANLGSVILIEPKRIEKEPHLHGRANYFLETNGRSNGLNLQLHQNNAKIAWKVNGTLKKSGDKKTATYYLNNTGIQEANLALQLEKSFSERLTTDLYFSTFNTELGVLRGAHIGNLTDLETAFQQEIPFFTETEFSYTIDVPKQRVHHHLLKIRSKYFIDQSQWFNFTAAGQLNNRKEFDVRRSGRSEIPALSLQQYTYFLELKYQKEFANDATLKTGIQSNITDNTNNPETNILPLIPDYLSYESGWYLMYAKKIRKSFFDLGIRYDNVLQNVVTIENTVPQKIVRYQNIYHNLSALCGWNYTLTKDLSLSWNIGYATRNPAINELYSAGLHQGVSGIEEGSVDLKPERSLKSTLSLKGNIDHKLTFEMLGYYQKIDDYIYLNPQDEIRLTIRGAFPVFKYEQTNAQIYGLDLLGTFELTESWKAEFAYSFIKGDDLTNDLPLINIPSNNFSGTITYAFLQPIIIGKSQFENLEIELNNQYVFEQMNLLTSQDFVAPPNAYNLLGLKIATDLQIGKTRIRWIVKVDNLLNVAYRDYLNRQRYFADDLGINATLGINVKF